MGRIVHVASARPRGAALWAWAAAAALMAAAAGIGLSRLFEEEPPQPQPARQVPAAPVPMAEAPKGDAVAPPMPVAAPVVVACPIQSLRLTPDGSEPRTICIDATLVQQSGSVRSYVVKAGGVQGWKLRIDMAERAVLKAALEARDGLEYACDAAQCVGRVVLGGPQPGGSGTLAVSELRLQRTALPGPSGSATDAVGVVIDARLAIPSDEQMPGLACTGPSIMIGAANGSSRKFCGQGGAGVEIADDEHRNYRFQDHEGRTLTVAVGSDQRVLGITLDGFSCQGSACLGASTTSAAPDDALAERSFFFGRTVLFEAGTVIATGAKPRPGLTLDGTLVMPGGTQ